MSAYEAVVVGAGPNGLAAAIALCRAGVSTLVVEAAGEPGGGARTAELTIPKLAHDVCSTVHPLGAASPWFRALALDEVGLEWVHSPVALAHVVGDRRVALLERSLDATCAGLGPDGETYRALIEPFVARFDELQGQILAPLRFPKDVALMARFGLHAMRSLEGLVSRFEGDEARALLAGIAAHAMVPLDRMTTASFALVLACAAHVVGWPLARGGSSAITRALVARLREAGGELECGRRIARLDELPPARAYLFDVTPRQLLAICGDRLPARWRRRAQRFRHGPGVFKLDWALAGPVPWKDARCARAATVHLWGTSHDVAAGEDAVHRGAVSERPFVLFVQPTLFDRSRVPAAAPGLHAGWAYCHVPNGSRLDCTGQIEGVIERAAPGFKDLILARAAHGPAAMEAHDANFIGGDINGGIADLGQLLFRPWPSLDPYGTGTPDIFLCSSSTPPGGGVHGMCGYWAAATVLRKRFGRDAPPLAESSLGAREHESLGHGRARDVREVQKAGLRRGHHVHAERLVSVSELRGDRRDH